MPKQQPGTWSLTIMPRSGSVSYAGQTNRRSAGVRLSPHTGAVLARSLRVVTITPLSGTLRFVSSRALHPTAGFLRSLSYAPAVSRSVMSNSSIVPRAGNVFAGV